MMCACPFHFRLGAVKTLMAFHPVVLTHAHTLACLSGSRFMPSSPTSHVQMDVHNVYENSHRGKKLNRLPLQPSVSDHYSDVKKLNAPHYSFCIMGPPCDPVRSALLLLSATCIELISFYFVLLLISLDYGGKKFYCFCGFH